jgi:hypothetical protein
MLPILAWAGSSPTKPDEPTLASARFAPFPPPTLSVEADFHDVWLTFVDNSMDDYTYYIKDQATGEVVAELQAPGIGGEYLVYIYAESGVHYTYTVSVLLNDMGSLLDNVGSISFTTPLEEPQLSFVQLPYAECSSVIELDIGGFDPTAGIEIYRASSADGPWGLIKSSTTPIHYYVDDVKPATTFFYKVRAFKGDVYSEYSVTKSATSLLDYYWPTFSASWVGTGVEVTLTDRTYADSYYEVERYDPYAGVSTIIYHETLADSGQTISFIDHGALPNKFYEYIFRGSSVLPCGNPNDVENELARVDIETGVGSDYTISKFTLYDLATGQDIGPLENGSVVVVDGSRAPLIRAYADDKTKAVMFFLNNHRHADNGPPLFTYRPGLTQTGHYILKATPSSEKNQKGIVGETVIIEFDVVNSDYAVTGFTLVDKATNQDIGPLHNGDVIDISSVPVIRASATPLTKAVMFFLNMKRWADNGPPEFTFKPGVTLPGHYVLKATPSSEKNAKGIIGATAIIEFDAICSACGGRIPEREETTAAVQKGVSLYPNPVVTESTLRVDATPGSSVRVQVTDEFGRMKVKEIKTSVDSSGAWTQSIQDLKLDRGVYVVHVTIDGERYMKRFVVN